MHAMRIYIILLGLLLPSVVEAQQNWLRSAGGNNLDEALDIAYTSSGDKYYVTGHFSGSCNFTTQTLSSSGLSDGFLARYDTDGTPLWVRKMGGTSSDKSVAVVSDDSGNAFICGYFNGTATFGTISLTATDSSDIFVAKYNAFGDVIWAKQAGSLGNDQANGIALDPSENVIITGTFRGNALFGGTLLNSTSYPTSTNPSSDIFVAKLDSNGGWLWAKKGSGTGDEKATDVCTDSQGNILFCGQFSSNLTLDVLHTNVAVNAGYIVKLNSSGNEQWFSRIVGSQVLPNALRCDAQNNVDLTGESVGQLIFESTNSVVVASVNSQSFFAAQYSSSGHVNWALEDGSVSYVSARAIAIGDDNEMYITGIFNCIFTEYADVLGDGLFNSVGYRDVFVVRFNSDGTRVWMNHYGGNGEDFCSGIAKGITADSPRITGSYETYFHVPGSLSTFQDNTTLFDPPSDLVNPNPYGPLCGYADYGSFIHLKAIYNKDIFIGNVVNLSLPVYDYYTHDDCNFPIEEPCLNDTNVPLVCADSITACGSAGIIDVTNTGTMNWIGPDYDFTWNDGSHNAAITAYTNGWYWATTTRADGCATWTDSIYVTILPVPDVEITDDAGVNFESPPFAALIALCAPDSVLLTGSNSEDFEGYWIDQNSTTIPGNPIQVSASGNYWYIVTGSNGCTNYNIVPVLFNDPLDTIAPVLQFSENNQPINDTITICGNEYITDLFIDLFEQDDFAIYVDALWQISTDEGYYPPYLGFESYTWLPQQSGWHYITAAPYIYSPEPCLQDTIWYPEQSLQVYINILEDPDPQPYINGDNTFCPGDTIMLVASNAPSYVWSGPFISSYIGNNTVMVTGPGNYSVSSFEEFPNGCSSTGLAVFNIQPYPQPQITSDPPDHVLCPGDSIFLQCQPASGYLWIGPLGAELGTTQSIYTNTPGSYLCVATIDGCTQESNVIELENYATPYLLAMPGTDLCATGAVTLFVQSNPGATITWLDPLSGNAPSMNVFDPDTYSASVEFCGIETLASIEITESTPIATITPSNNVLCPGSSLQLTTTSGMSSYQWFPGGQNTQDIVITQPGTYSVTVENDQGCDGHSENFVIDVYDIQAPVAPNISVCLGDDAVFTAASNDVAWSTSPGADYVGFDPTYTAPDVIAPMSLFVYGYDGICYSLPDEVFCTIYPSSQIHIDEMETNYCGGETISFSTQEPDGTNINYNWLMPDGSHSVAPQFSIDPATTDDNGWYVLNASDVLCTINPDSVFIVVENPVNDALIEEPELKICVGWELIIQTDLVANSYLWTTPVGTFSTPEIIIDESTYDHEGNFVLNVPGIYCNTNSDTIHVDIVHYPEFNLNDTSVYCSSGYMTAHVPSGFDAYQWSTGDSGPSAVVPDNGFISVEVTNLPGCIKRDSVQINNIHCIDHFPTIFTPGGDSYNDVVDFGWLRIPIDRVLIYNRWGNLIKELQNNPFIWNGTNTNNERVSEGVYYYVIESGAPIKAGSAMTGYLEVIFDDNVKNN